MKYKHSFMTTSCNTLKKLKQNLKIKINNKGVQINHHHPLKNQTCLFQKTCNNYGADLAVLHLI